MKIVGYVTTEPKITSDLPAGSCLTIFIRENGQCNGGLSCNIQPLARKQITNPRELRIRDGKLRYSIKLEDGKPGQYEAEAVINKGWCQEAGKSEWIRYGDYHNDISSTVVIRNGTNRSVFRKDIATVLNKVQERQSGRLHVLFGSKFAFI